VSDPVVTPPQLPRATAPGVPGASRRIPAALINLLIWPGVGHGLVGRTRAVAPWVLATLLATFAVRFSVWALLAIIALRIGAAIDVARRVTVRSLPTGGALAGWIVAALAALAIPLVARALLVEAFKIPSESMTPTLMRGDHIFVDKLAYQLRDPRRGEVVVHQGRDGRDFVRRLVAVPGDTVELRCGRLILNGQVVTGATTGEVQFVVDEMGHRDVRHASIATEQVGGVRYAVVVPDHPAPQLRDFPRRGDGDRYATAYLEDSRSRAPVTPVVVTSPAAGPCEPQAHIVVPPGTGFLLGDHRTNSFDSRSVGPEPLASFKGPVVGTWWPVRRLGDL
jgi:signal peptidase I